MKPKYVVTEKENLFGLIAGAVKVLRESGQYGEARCMTAECHSAIDYDSTLGIISKYVEVYDEKTI